MPREGVANIYWAESPGNLIGQTSSEALSGTVCSLEHLDSRSTELAEGPPEKLGERDGR